MPKRFVQKKKDTDLQWPLWCGLQRGLLVRGHAFPRRCGSGLAPWITSGGWNKKKRSCWLIGFIARKSSWHRWKRDVNEGNLTIDMWDLFSTKYYWLEEDILNSWYLFGRWHLMCLFTVQEFRFLGHEKGCPNWNSFALGKPVCSYLTLLIWNNEGEGYDATIRCDWNKEMSNSVNCSIYLWRWRT